MPKKSHSKQPVVLAAILSGIISATIVASTSGHAEQGPVPSLHQMQGASMTNEQMQHYQEQMQKYFERLRDSSTATPSPVLLQKYQSQMQSIVREQMQHDMQRAQREMQGMSSSFMSAPMMMPPMQGMSSSFMSAPMMMPPMQGMSSSFSMSMPAVLAPLSHISLDQYSPKQLAKLEMRFEKQIARLEERIASLDDKITVSKDEKLIQFFLDKIDQLETRKDALVDTLGEIHDRIAELGSTAH
jgi:hypothetical protein